MSPRPRFFSRRSRSPETPVDGSAVSATPELPAHLRGVLGDHIPHSLGEGDGHTDTAGTPWAGRTFAAHDTTYQDDDGSAPAALAAAQAAFVAGTASIAEVLDALRDARLLIPLIAHAGDVGVNDHGLAVDKTQELSIITVAGPDGRNVMPVFSSVTAMQAWNPKARPVPADGVRVALAAAEESTELVVLDATTAQEIVFRRPALWALAQSLPWTPSHADAEVRSAFLSSISSEASVLAVEIGDGDPAARLRGAEVLVTLTLVPGLSREVLDDVLGRLAAVWAADEVIVARVDSMSVKIRSAA